jgi:hypothetical protein
MYDGQQQQLFWNNNRNVMGGTRANEILGIKQHKGISTDIMTSSKLETEGYSFWPAP